MPEAAAEQENRQVVGRVHVGVAQATAEQHHRAVQQGPAAFLRIPQLGHEIAQDRQLPRFNLAKLGKVFRIQAVMGPVMVFAGQVNLYGNQPGRVGLQRQDRQAEEQLQTGVEVLFVANVFERGDRDLRLGLPRPLLGTDQALLDFADGGEILIQPFPVGGATCPWSRLAWTRTVSRTLWRSLNRLTSRLSLFRTGC